MKLLLFTDDMEEFLIVAADRTDAFNLIAERAGAEAADELAASTRVYEYPPEFTFRNGDTAATIVAREGRCVFSINVLDMRLNAPRFPKPK
jgi:hypothetical protein